MTGVRAFYKFNDIELPNPDHVKLCEVWIKTYFKYTRSLRTNTKLGSSYHLKHVIENWARAIDELGFKLKDINGNEIKNQCYVSNGAFIQAMVNLNYLYSAPHGTINPYFDADYKGPYLMEDGRKVIPNDKSDWLKVLCPFLENIIKN